MTIAEYERIEELRQQAACRRLTERQWLALEEVVHRLAKRVFLQWFQSGQPRRHFWFAVRELQDLLKEAGRIPNVANILFDENGDFLYSDGHGDD